MARAKASAVRALCSVCSRSTSTASSVQPWTNSAFFVLELQEPDAVGEELLGRPCVVLLELHELETAFGEPHAPALGGGEVLGYGLEGVALGLCHLSGRAGRLVDVVGGGFHCVPPWSINVCYYILTTHISDVNLAALGPSLLPLFTGVRGR